MKGAPRGDPDPQIAAKKADNTDTDRDYSPNIQKYSFVQVGPLRRRLAGEEEICREKDDFVRKAGAKLEQPNLDKTVW